MENRDFCPRCAIKHLAQARALMLESGKGYAHHVWFAMGHMAEAEDELLAFMPTEAELVRVARKELETSAPEWKVPDFKKLMYEIATNAMLEEVQD